MNTKMDESDICLLDRDKRLFSEPETLTPCLFGESLSTIVDNKESIVPCSATKAQSDLPTLSDRLTQSLITAGLVKGITHTSIRKQYGLAIRASALWPLDGGNAE
jgi:hypothetical protein